MINTGEEEERARLGEQQVVNLERSAAGLNQTTELDYLCAAQLVRDARDIRNMSFKKTEEHLRSYELYLNKLVTQFLYLVIIVHLLLPIIEYPAAIDTPFWVPCCIEIFCVCIYLIRWFHVRSFQPVSAFRSDKKYLVALAIYILILVDIAQYMLVNALDVNFKHRFTRFLRVFIYINFNEGKELRRAVRNVRKTLPDIFNIFAMFFSSLLIFSFLAWQLFKSRPEGRGLHLVYYNNQSYFQNYEDSLWDLYVAVTTANFPDVMMPAYDYNPAMSIFFVVFMLVNLYIFMNITLATIYSNYKRHLKEEVESVVLLKRDQLKAAFDIIKVSNPHASDHHNFMIDSEIFNKLMKHVSTELSQSEIDCIFRILDANDSKVLEFPEFIYLADLLNIRISEIKDRQNLFERYIPKIYSSKPSKILKNLVKHSIFHVFFNIIIFANIAFAVFYDQEDVEWGFLVVFTIEIALKVYALGFKQFASDYWNIFDTTIIFSGVIAGIIDQMEENSKDGQNYFEVVLILRTLRLIKILSAVQRFRTIITTIAVITPSLITYGLLLLTIFYVFSMIGMEIFATTITTQDYVPGMAYDCKNPNLLGTEFANYKYCRNNFASFPNSFVLLFELMVVNQWHIISRGFEEAVQSKWTRFYFLFFHISCVIVSLNIFTAFVIEAFILEYEREKEPNVSKLESRINELGLSFDQSLDNSHSINQAEASLIKRIKAYIDSLKSIFKVDDEVEVVEMSQGKEETKLKSTVKFHINSKEPKSIEILLQRMFMKELKISDDD